MRLAAYRDHVERVGEVVAHVMSDLDASHRIGSLAARASFSEFHFQRVFARITGEHAMAFVRRLRLERSAWRLQGTADPVTEIAFDAGFESLEAFDRAFRVAFGITPGQYRKGSWPMHWIANPTGTHFDPNGALTFRPLARRGEGVPFEVREVPPIGLAAREHQGPVQFIAATWMRFAEELKAVDSEALNRPLVTFAPELTQEVPISEIRMYVAVPPENPDEFARLDQIESWTIGGGSHLIARHVGSGHLLGDFWFRVWAEALPEARGTVRDSPCFQVYPNGIIAGDPDAFVADVCIPLVPNRAF